ncbi:MAG: LysR substrate-binding domain-containing protein [Burkholderiales bacterium]
MDLSDLHIFKTVVEQGGIARAAIKLHRVPSNISTRVRQLEQSVGAQLFVREKQRLFLSPSGEHLLGYADKLLRLSAEALGAVSRAPPRGVLRLGALESTTASRLPKVLAAYHKAYPDVRVELVTGTNDALTHAVLERRVEAAFVAEVPASKELVAERLFHERLVIISSLDHRPIRRPQDVDGDSVIAFPSGCAYRRVLQHWLGNDRVASVRVLELSSYHAIVACVASGTGIALVPESVLDTVQHAAVARHALPKVHGQVTTPLIWRAADPSPALLALRKVLAAVARPAAAR